jgi:hypothetical protein
MEMHTWYARPTAVLPTKWRRSFTIVIRLEQKRQECRSTTVCRPSHAPLAVSSTLRRLAGCIGASERLQHEPRGLLEFDRCRWPLHRCSCMSSVRLQCCCAPHPSLIPTRLRDARSAALLNSVLSFADHCAARCWKRASVTRVGAVALRSSKHRKTRGAVLLHSPGDQPAGGPRVVTCC